MTAVGYLHYLFALAFIKRCVRNFNLCCDEKQKANCEQDCGQSQRNLKIDHDPHVSRHVYSNFVLALADDGQPPQPIVF